MKREGYGLIRKGGGSNGDVGSSSNNVHRGYLGPQQDLVKQREEKLRQEQQAKLNRVRENVKTLTEEEKAERLRAMERDANMHNDFMSKRVSNSKIPSSLEDSSNIKQENIQEGGHINATFLKEMRNEVYSSGATNMEDRLNQNRHYVQSLSQLDS